MAIVYLALGSNLGDRRALIDKALLLLKKAGVKIVNISSIIETEPVGGPQQGKYLNAVIKARTSLSAEDLLNIIHKIERQLGRIRKILNGPRLIDIDILLYDELKLISRTLIIPHPRMLERAFVMEPLKEINPRLCALLER